MKIKRTHLLQALLFLASCQTVKPYQRAFLNDRDMQNGKNSINKLTNSVHDYKEGASGGGGGKTSGGCGCN